MSWIVFGATGLCGLEILKTADKSASVTQLTSVTRRSFDFASEKVNKIVEADSAKYPEIIKSQKPSVVLSGLATTRAAAGSAEKFVAIDHDINLEIAKAAKEAGAHTFVIVSSAGASALLPFLYFKTKGRLDDDIIALKFPRTIILRPGPLLGEREKPKGFLNDATAAVFKHVHNTFLGNALFAPIYGSELALVAVHLAEQPPKDDLSKPEVNIVGSKELVKLANSLK